MLGITKLLALVDVFSIEDCWDFLDFLDDGNFGVVVFSITSAVIFFLDLHMKNIHETERNNRNERLFCKWASGDGWWS